MKKNTIKFYPVGNGDTSLITLKDETTILVDCNIRKSAEGDSDPTMFDVKEDLLNSIKKRGSIPFIDVFILTHGDSDHCTGYTKNFYQGDPKKYSDKNSSKSEIMMDTMWFSPMALEKSTNDEAETFRKEARRRIQLHRDKSPDKDLAGNRIVIIGYNGNEQLDGLDLVTKVPGDIVTRFNNKNQDTFSVFIHAPYKAHLKNAGDDKNSTSVVFQARYKEKATDTKFSTLAIFGGDADHYAWEIILEKTKKYGKDKSEQALDYDLFMAPHHCSWSYFNDRPQADHPVPVKHSLEVLDYKRPNARVIASSFEVLKPKPNPPHYAAKQEYVKKVGDTNFLNTETFKVKGKTPQPIVFEITGMGPVLEKEEEGSARVSGSSSLGAVGSVSKYGA